MLLVDCLMSVLLAKQRTLIGNIFFAKPFIAFAPCKVTCTAHHILMKCSEKKGPAAVLDLTSLKMNQQNPNHKKSCL